MLLALGLIALPASHVAASAGEWIYLPNGQREDGQFVDDILSQVMAERGVAHPSRPADFPHGLRVELVRAKDVGEAVNRLFYERGWTDGLPIVPPTQERVRAMLRGTDRTASDVVAVLEPMKGLATVEKVAVNAVMAGCDPMHLPVVLAAVEAVADPAFGLLGVQTTTNPDTPLMLVNGPVREVAGINSGTNAFGPGWVANACIGRALRLVLNNVGGAWPGVSDMTAIGWPGKFAACAGENEEASPWEPLHVELGFDRSQSVVTVVPAEGMHNVTSIGRSAEQFLQAVADHLAGLDRARRQDVLLLLTPDTARMLAAAGYDKTKVREYVAARAVMPYARYRAKFIETRSIDLATLRSHLPETGGGEPPGDALVPVPLVERLLIAVVGGPGEKNMIVPVWSAGRSVTRAAALPRASKPIERQRVGP